jgi:23S rRNA pseudouridine955/2504/2580 synthase
MPRRDYDHRTVSEADRAFVRGFVIHEDEAVLAFNKPAGLPVQTRNPDDRTLDSLLAAFAKSNGKRPRLVHRLDAQTSGVIIAGKTQPAAAALSAAFAGRDMAKTYLALVSGEAFRTKRGVFDQQLVRFRPKPELELMRAARPGDEGAQTAVTRWTVLGSSGQFHLLRLEPETGRMHQIRAHLSLAGRPILGDPYYGGAMSVAGKDVRRLMLHAMRLSGPHPSGGRFVVFADPPPDFAAARLAAGIELA